MPTHRSATFCRSLLAGTLPPKILAVGFPARGLGERVEHIMLHRLLFVAGMTVGVMTPLLWAAYVARPASHAPQAAAVQTAKVTPVRPKPAPVPAERTTSKEAAKKKAVTTTAAMRDVTAAIPPASAKPAPVAPVSVAARFEPTPLPRPINRPRLTPPRAKQASLGQPHRTLREADDRDVPAVVSSYYGAHIITVCAALTMSEQLRAGCP